jgi:hypothetical protein
VSQDREVIFQERFACRETANRYATLLRQKVQRLASAGLGAAIQPTT